MGDVGFFDEVATVGDEILSELRGRDDATMYLLRARDVYQLMVVIHDDLVNATVEVSTATTLEEARHVLHSLHHDALASVFRARRWCDELEALGHDLRVLPPGTAVDDAGTWDQFTSTLQQREGEVAWLYENAMYEVISRAEVEVSLEDLQSYIDAVCHDLVTQKAKFDLLAKRAAAIARKR
jgi:hypothetical protein